MKTRRGGTRPEQDQKFLTSPAVLPSSGLQLSTGVFMPANPYLNADSLPLLAPLGGFGIPADYLMAQGSVVAPPNAFPSKTTHAKRGWTDEEDRIVSHHVISVGRPAMWSVCAKKLPGRIGKNCRERSSCLLT